MAGEYDAEAEAVALVGHVGAVRYGSLVTIGAALRAAHEAGRVEMRAEVAGVMDGLGEGVVACHSVRDYVIAALDAAGEVE